jgi:hypothetical protein
MAAIGAAGGAATINSSLDARKVADKNAINGTSGAMLLETLDEIKPAVRTFCSEFCYGRFFNGRARAGAPRGGLENVWCNHFYVTERV